MAATDRSQSGELDNSSSSFIYSIPLQQLRALARAANGGYRAKLVHKQSRLMSLPPASLPSDSSFTVRGDSREECRVKREDVSQKNSFNRKPPRQHVKSKGEQSQGRSKKPTGQLKKNAKKKLPTEVSSRRPHYATGQPLTREALSGAGGKKPAEFCEKNQDAVREDHLLARASVCFEKEGKEGQHRICCARLNQDHIESLPEGTHCTGESDVQGFRRHQHVIRKGSVGGQARVFAEGEHEISMTPHGTVQEKRLSQICQEREAALQRHLKSLRSLRMRLATEGQAATRNYASRVSREVRDPRFSEACGPLNLRMVGKAYAFLDDMRKEEAEQLQQFLKKGARRDEIESTGVREGRERAGAARQGEAQKEAAQKALQRLRSQEDARKRKGVELVVKGRLAQAEKACIAQTGKKPFFVRRKEMRRLVQAEWQKAQHGGSAPGRRKAAKQEEKKARNKLAKERRRNAVPLRRSAAEKADF